MTLSSPLPPPQIPRVDGEYDLKVPRDMAYVFSGAYVPLSCKIIEQVPGSRRPPGRKPPANGLDLQMCAGGRC